MPVQREPIDALPYDLFQLFLVRRRLDSQEEVMALYHDLPPPSDEVWEDPELFDQWALWAEKENSKPTEGGGFSAKRYYASVRRAGLLCWVVIENNTIILENWDLDGQPIGRLPVGDVYA
ncbi:MAG: hypothetical protein QXI19_13435 [Candidatus Caldarchaeum sp.]